MVYLCRFNNLAELETTLTQRLMVMDWMSPHCSKAEYQEWRSVTDIADSGHCPVGKESLCGGHGRFGRWVHALVRELLGGGL